MQWSVKTQTREITPLADQFRHLNKQTAYAKVQTIKMETSQQVRGGRSD